MNQLQELYQKYKGLMLCELSPRNLEYTWRIIREDLDVVGTLSNGEYTMREWEGKIENIVKRLKMGTPIQYITGKSIFYGLEFFVNEHVLIPRPETEELVHWVLETLNRKGEGSLHVFEAGVGSGCVALTLKDHCAQWQVTGIDVSEEALKIARRNAEKLGLHVLFEELDFLNEMQRNSLDLYDVIVSNPPYITTKEKVVMEANVLDFEPSVALFVEEDPLIFYRAILHFSTVHLNNGGYIFVECSEFNAEKVVDLFKEGGLKEVVLKEDMQGKPRMVRAHKMH